jgi:DNA-binding CsgD family transcriptional regulator
MTSPVQLTSTDIRGALRLANELHTFHGDPTDRRRRFVSGLCHLLEADAGVTAMGRLTNGAATMHDLVLHGWTGRHLTAAERHFQEVLGHDPMVSVVQRESARDGGALTTRLRNDVYDDARWSGLPLVQLRRGALSLDDCLVSLYPLGLDGASAWVFLYRRADGAAAPFTPRHREMLHVIHSEMDWFYRPAANPLHSAIESLSERERQTLMRLLAGHSEKEAAAEMGLSPHTVHVYIKSLYRAFKVNTRNELLALFIDYRGKP